MDYKIKSAITVAIILVIMVSVGFLINSFQGGITGGSITKAVACYSNADCNDWIECTVDSCKNAGTERAFCDNAAITFCQDNDGCCPAGCSEINDNDC